jgi:REP-associated tyrosine transposase
VSLKTTIARAEFLRELKKASSAWAAENGDARFAWQEGYAIFSTSRTHCRAVTGYIARQQEHHQRVPLVEEFKRLLRKNGVAYDPRFLE